MSERYALEALQTGLWKIGRLAELNDPYDCQPVLTNQPHSENPDRFTSDYFRRFNDIVGVFCYSAKIDDPVIWSHYADVHRGIALAFEYTDPVNEKGLFQMGYNENRPSLDYLQLEKLRAESEWDHLVEVIRGGFTSKAKSWEYESEYRHFIRLDGQGNQLIGRNYFRGIPISELYAVVLGARCSVTENDIARIFSFSNGRVGGAKIRRAQMNSSSYKMDGCYS